MDDDISNVMKRKTEAIDDQIKVKQLQLQRQQTINRKLLDILTKSEPMERANGIVPKYRPEAIVPNPDGFPAASPESWIKCPIRIIDQWTYVIKDKIVMGVQIENLLDDRCLAETHGNILAISEDGQDWLTANRSCMVQIRHGMELVETNILRPHEKSILTVSATTPSNIFSSDFILIGHISINETLLENKQLPPLLQPEKWTHWNGELARTQKDIFDPTGTSVPIINSLVQSCAGKDFDKDRQRAQRILTSIYVCQQQKRIRVDMECEISAKEVFCNIKLNLANYSPSQDSAKYCRLPIFDGILIFPEMSKFAQRQSNFEFLISGWSLSQIDQFLQFLDSTLNGATIMILDDDLNADNVICASHISSEYLKITEKLETVCAEDMDLGGQENSREVNGDEYREIRLEMCAVEVLEYL